MQNIENYFIYVMRDDFGEDSITIESIKKIQFKDVSYKYPFNKNYALKNINFSFEENDKIALVGENGSGKSTLIKLLLGLYDDYEGEIKINDIDLRKISKKSYHNCLSTIFQDFNKYQFTAKENIAYGDINNVLDLTKIKNAANLSEADKFINKFEDTYNQQLGYFFQNGIEISGGQWQKLALARMFMKKCGLYILDEPTSALDPLSEKKFFENFLLQDYQSIKLFSTHRFINTNYTNYILVLDDGEICEEGTHKHLYRKKGKYYKMYKYQMLESENIMVRN